MHTEVAKDTNPKASATYPVYIHACKQCKNITVGTQQYTETLVHFFPK